VLGSHHPQRPAHPAQIRPPPVHVALADLDRPPVSERTPISSRRGSLARRRPRSARPLADRLAAQAPADETVAVFRVRRDVEYGLAFYRNSEVVNYEQTGVPDGQHLLVVRETGPRGVDLRTSADLAEYLEGRHYEQLFTWPEQGLVVYLVGSR